MIDEKRLIEVIDKNFGHTDGASTIKQIIKEQPKVGEWIPCNERLPKEPKQNPKLDDRPMEMYLVDNGEDYPFRAFWNGKYFHDGWRRLDVLAWMPLPELYKGETE